MKNYLNIFQINIIIINNDSLKKIVTIKNICSKINTYLCHYFNKNKNLDEQLMSIKYNNNNITSEDNTVTFIRNNKTYEKKIYYFITDNMKANISNKINIKQFFVDFTYYSIPRKNNSFKLFLIIGFNTK